MHCQPEMVSLALHIDIIGVAVIRSSYAALPRAHVGYRLSFLNETITLCSMHAGCRGTAMSSGVGTVAVVAAMAATLFYGSFFFMYH